MSILKQGRTGEQAALKFINSVIKPELVFQPDWMYIKGGKWFSVEVKYKEKFKSPPFDGHGLDIREVQARLLLQKLFGIRCLFLVFDKEDNNIYFQFLDVLEAGVKATTANGKIIIYPLENFRVSDRNVGEFIREQDPFEKAMDIICELEKDQETMERLKENL